MSYNVDSIEVVASEGLSMSAPDVKRLLKQADYIPECSFLHGLSKAVDALPYGSLEPLPIKRLDWYGEGSGYSWDFFVDHVVPAVKGSALLVIVWEGGDSLKIARLKDGKLHEADLYKLLASTPVLYALESLL